MPNHDQKGIALMVLSMASFALSDFFVKLASANFSLGQLLLFFGVGSSVCFYAVAYRRQLRVFSAQALEPPVLIRTAGEVIAGTFIILAITYGSLSGASAIMQIQPLVVALAAYCLLREGLGTRRLLAICVGLAGALIVIQPSPENFDLPTVFALIAVIGMTMRDLASRVVARYHSNTTLALYGTLATIGVGLVMIAFEGDTAWRFGWHWLYVLAMIACATVALYSLTYSTRISELSITSPYRYTRLPFSLLLGVFALGEQLTPNLLYGSALIVASGIYLLYKEAAIRQSQVNQPLPPNSQN